ncbi:hypothetical protein SUGI_0020300 [Cryptomeria japonica]|nr:hypothetical protein SUGI_0020300 [Cryptomeria japonica]
MQEGPLSGIEEDKKSMTSVARTRWEPNLSRALTEALHAEKKGRKSPNAEFFFTTVAGFKSPVFNICWKLLQTS